MLVIAHLPCQDAMDKSRLTSKVVHENATTNIELKVLNNPFMGLGNLGLTHNCLTLQGHEASASLDS